MKNIPNLKKIFFSLLISFIISYSIAGPGDTLTVQTLTFGDITKRRGIWVFPDTSHHYRKILMYYTLKCDPATTHDNYNCGEWDYLTYNYIYDHTGIMDSSLLTQPSFIVGGISPDSFSYTTTPVWTYYKNWQYFPVYDSIISESEIQTGSGDTSFIHPFNTSQEVSRAQYLWLESELSGGGLVPGEIHKLKLDITALGNALNHLKIRMKNSTKTELQPANFEKDGFTLVYNMNTNMTITGEYEFEFSAPFTWDGVSNIVIDFTFTNNNDGTDFMIAGDTTGFSSCVYSVKTDGYLAFNGPDFADVPMAAFAGIDSAITISFWAYGDPDIQPQNDYCFEARDADGNRVLNVHLPWSDEHVYWDAGNDGSMYDRIDKLCSSLIYKGSWNHWAFTKDVNQGWMRIYLNGSAWQLGTNRIYDMSGITSFKFGSNAYGTGNYDGYINEFRIWNTVLSSTEIKNWRYKDIDPSHPDYGNLAACYSFDENNGTMTADHGTEGHHASLVGLPQWKRLIDLQIFRNMAACNERPKVTLVQGNYNLHLDSLLVTDSVVNPGTTLFLFNDSALLPLASGILTVWEAGYTYVYDHDTICDSVYIAPENTLTLEEYDYWGEPFEILDRYEIGRFITPYGIGLDLGDEGFRWIYDVTDYAFLLHDTVDFQAGNQQELIDVKFLLIEGTPPREMVQMDRVWGQTGSFYYKDLDDDVSLSAQSIAIHPDAQSCKIKTRLTGHGHNSNTGDYPHCCEWKDNTHYLYVNGTLADSWHIFQYSECAQNPVFPQGGTWPGAREGWCPGDVVGDSEFELTDYLTSGSITIDYDITSVPASNQGMGWGNYVISMHLFQYGAAAHSLDAEVYEVITPNDWGYYSRVNPICSDPRVVLRNAGATTLTSMVITYGVSGGPQQAYTWTGNLAFMESEEVQLPVNSYNFWIGDGANIFTATAGSPNYGQDQYELNNSVFAAYTAPDILPSVIIIELHTNNIPGDNSYTLKDLAGNIVVSANGFSANTTYYDTLDLAAGCYELSFLDTGHDGLYYWAYTAQGTGYLRIRQPGGAVLVNFEPEFGYEIRYAFTSGDLTYLQRQDNSVRIFAYPNPSDGNFTLDISGIYGNAGITVMNILGEVVWSSTAVIDGFFMEDITLKGIDPGIYLLKVYYGKKVFYDRILVY
ncbi:MAG: T9SS type A sorting domain-containing protein [Bacteroidetes bacterium]|nr:T9SS type A sorting domain-containing protein [Bacteroidota bacterium]